jgi:hypothetical protein
LATAIAPFVVRRIADFCTLVRGSDRAGDARGKSALDFSHSNPEFCHPNFEESIVRTP